MPIYKHIEDLVVSADFSSDGKHRYRLQATHTRKELQKSVCAIMLNPSDASKEIADKSVQFLETLVFLKDYAEFKGVGKLTIVNLFSYIQTNDFKGGPDKVDSETDRHIGNSIEDADIILLAWGKDIYSNRIEAVKSMIRTAGKIDVFATERHPSRGRYSNFITRVLAV